MTAFYIGQHEIDDEAAFADYLKQTIPFIEKHGGRYLTKAGTHEMLEGQRPSRVVIVEFPSKQAIKDWYNDPGYRPLVAKRHATARSVMIAVEGREVRFGSQADICNAIGQVRFTPNSDGKSRHSGLVSSTGRSISITGPSRSYLHLEVAFVGNPCPAEHPALFSPLFRSVHSIAGARQNPTGQPFHSEQPFLLRKMQQAYREALCSWLHQSRADVAKALWGRNCHDYQSITSGIA